MAKIITVANQKGGVGKSTTVLNLGYALGQAGKRVLLIDLDPQASITLCFGVENHEKLKTTVYHLIKYTIEGEPLPPKEDYIIKKDNVDLIPCNITLSAIDNELKEALGGEQTICDIISDIKDDYDYILIDTLPSLNLLTINALTASDGVIITVSPQYLSVAGINLLLKTIDRVKSRVNKHLEIDGILMTICDNRTSLYREISGVIEEYYGKVINVFNTYIPNSIKVGEANLKKQSIIEYDPKNKASQAYLEFAQEVLNRG